MTTAEQNNNQDNQLTESLDMTEFDLSTDDIYNDEYNGGYQPIYRTDKQDNQTSRDNKGKRKTNYAKLREQKRSYE